MRQGCTAHYTLPPQIAESALPPARGLLTQKPGPAKLLGGDWVALQHLWLIRPGPGLIMLCCLGQGRWRCSLFRGGHFTSFKVWCPFLHVSILLHIHSLFLFPAGANNTPTFLNVNLNPSKYLLESIDIFIIDREKSFRWIFTHADVGSCLDKMMVRLWIVVLRFPGGGMTDWSSAVWWTQWAVSSRSRPI